MFGQDFYSAHSCQNAKIIIFNQHNMNFLKRIEIFSTT